MGEGTEELRTPGSTTPELSDEDRRAAEINRDIERTRANLGQNLDELGDKISPSQVMTRQKQAARNRLVGMKERVMGSASQAGSSVSDSASGAAQGVSDTATGAVQSVQAKAEGNPLAAGVIAFGAGMLLSSLLPSTRVEQRVAQQGLDAAKEHGQPVVDEAKSLASDMGAQLKETAATGAEEVRTSAQESAQHLKDEGRDSAQKVKDQQSS
ncbi:DUF3618 domain-containing protein [Nocardioides jishulii]|uniref:DUF3618 domain-containing protein n=1 Tax=Nocardioides jishulii TaxID=2575440 RepID=A0A4U2YN33_9ACTN|nr:DUF3618 domain-containing protein [Nocardioides jishulii]QCX27899.1 DUF3618 domain-containing protein [Nocardioides jishulii]TKI62706.1 DUF3618 domain-containing protein [Nocardioides jishulii]